MEWTEYFIVEQAQGWRVNVRGPKLPKVPESRAFPKEEAVAGAKLLAATTRPSVVRVLARDGSVESEWMFDVVTPSGRLNANQA